MELSSSSLHDSRCRWQLNYISQYLPRQAVEEGIVLSSIHHSAYGVVAIVAPVATACQASKHYSSVIPVVIVVWLT